VHGISVKTKKGLSLAELLISVFVLSIGILSVLLFYTNTITSVQYARDMTMATTHGEYIFEEMQTRSSLANITATDWVAWGEGAGLNTLPSESIDVDFVDTTADPLDITTTINWIRNERASSISLTTHITK